MKHVDHLTFYKPCPKCSRKFSENDHYTAAYVEERNGKKFVCISCPTCSYKSMLIKDADESNDPDIYDDTVKEAWMAWNEGREYPVFVEKDKTYTKIRDWSQNEIRVDKSKAERTFVTAIAKPNSIKFYSKTVLLIEVMIGNTKYYMYHHIFSERKAIDVYYSMHETDAWLSCVGEIKKDSEKIYIHSMHLFKRSKWELDGVHRLTGV